jgi:hypothetical protein
VVGLASIYLKSERGHHYPEAINIVIEQLENQPMIEETPDETEFYTESSD